MHCNNHHPLSKEHMKKKTEKQKREREKETEQTSAKCEKYFLKLTIQKKNNEANVLKTKKSQDKEKKKRYRKQDTATS